jgi:Common central domain of tyrosinase/RTX calcium-binding nonapeptide repeat (4 copies)
MIDSKISIASVAALVCAAGAALAEPAAYAAPCGITAVSIQDESPLKLDTATSDDERDKRRGPTKNVGQEVIFNAGLTGDPTGAVSARWLVSGDLIDDYAESPAEIKNNPGDPETDAVANPFTLDEHREFEGGRAVFRGTPIRFYWRMRGVSLPSNTTVTLEVSEKHDDDAVPHLCAASQAAYTVERNKTDEESQPEDFYAEINHTGQLLREHLRWHVAHACCTGYDGSLFPVFHSRFLANYDAFRATFGYPAKVLYRPPDDLPTEEGGGFFTRGYTLLHTAEDRVTKPGDEFNDDELRELRRPTWATLAGGSLLQPRLRGSDCTGPVPAGPGRQRLADFPTLAELGCALERPWHNGVHGMVGGDMSNAMNAPKDPIFWRWHGYLNSVFREYPRAGGLITRAAPASPVASAVQPRRRGRTCNGLVATIRGTSGPDRLRGTRRADVIWGGGGPDRIAGRTGSDIICGGRGNDRLDGGSGFDTVRGGRGRDRIVGGRGGDDIEGGPARDRIAGGAGPDVLFGGRGRDVLSGGASNEWILNGGAGNDRIRGGGGVDNLHGGRGDDRLGGGAGGDTLDGGEGDDAIDGGSGEDALVYIGSERGVQVDLGDGTATGDGRDRVEGIDHVEGSDHADTIEGGSGDETISGGGGNDDISGGGGEDALSGGTGNDDVAGGGGGDYCAEADAASCEG